MSDKVINLFDARKSKKEEKKNVTEHDAPASDAPKEEAFDAVAEKNKKNEERLRQERLNANKSVLRSYRIKH